ncbi:sensor histidine kinase [Paenibacillus soyae]|uniref:histidine kinase n=1 Tax=Paenibacillus soyae TaxID=2969249 RepID=A0A9X2MU89_9BACL|nr:HAMP domain-containing sensor histidine kinase [Paenibacillus soyae]MCR2806605.1 HAMP domain-containing histidine kinase [Paenibacillus soyae]
MKLKLKLASKIHFYSSVLFALLLILMNLSIYGLFSRMSVNSQLEQTEAQAVQVAERIRQSAGAIPAADLLRAYVPLDGMARIVGKVEEESPASGESIAAVTSSSEQELSRSAAEFSSDAAIKRLRIEGRSYAHASVPIIWPDGAVVNVQLTESLEPTLSQLSVLRLVLILVTIIALVPVVISSRVLAKLIMHPITAMTDTMSEIRRSGRFRKLEQEGRSKDELFEMGETFNEMIELLERNFEKQKRFVSDASHELKTPLTVIESYAKLIMRRGNEKPELIGESVQAIYSEAVRMKELTEQLLLLAKQEEQWDAELEETDLSVIAEESAKAIRRAYGREVQVHIPQEPVMALTDGNKLRQVLFIFMDNARKYSAQEITVAVSRRGDECVITTQDRGIGIPADELPKVFDRFYRVDEARGRKAGGAGLGLSLAKEIAEAIGANISLESEPGIGTKAIIRLPAVKEMK